MEPDLRKSSESTIAKNYDEVYIKNFHIHKKKVEFFFVIRNDNLVEFSRIMLFIKNFELI